jgi:hypothetical protein
LHSTQSQITFEKIDNLNQIRIISIADVNQDLEFKNKNKTRANFCQKFYPYQTFETGS